MNCWPWILSTCPRSKALKLGDIKLLWNVQQYLNYFIPYLSQIFDKMVTELRENPVTDYESLNKLQYTEMVILESLRMAPVLLRGTRWLNKPLQVETFFPEYNIIYE